MPEDKDEINYGLGSIQITVNLDTLQSNVASDTYSTLQLITPQEIYDYLSPSIVRLQKDIKRRASQIIITGEPRIIT